MTMENDGAGEARWAIDLEAIVAKNVRRLREAHGLSQQQLGNDLIPLGVGMHQTTVAKLEAGSKPLRLNEVTAIAAYFEVPIESLWEESGEILNVNEVAELLRESLVAETALAMAHSMFAEAVEQVSMATAMANKAGEDRRKAEVRQRVLAARLAELEQRRTAQTEMEGLSHGEH
jgi:transcriptional regulator with XRE-family HTH domain